MFQQVMNWMRDNKILPQISDTERQALEAGDVWIDGQFFGGKVDFENILAENYDQLPAHEQAFLDGPVEELLKMADGYELSRTRKLPDDVFKFMADNGFFAIDLSPPAVLNITDISFGILSLFIISRIFFLFLNIIFLLIPPEFAEFGINTQYLPARDKNVVIAAPLFPRSSFVT